MRLNKPFDLLEVFHRIEPPVPPVPRGAGDETLALPPEQGGAGHVEQLADLIRFVPFPSWVLGLRHVLLCMRIGTARLVHRPSIVNILGLSNYSTLKRL